MTVYFQENRFDFRHKIRECKLQCRDREAYGLISWYRHDDVLVDQRCLRDKILCSVTWSTT